MAPNGRGSNREPITASTHFPNSNQWQYHCGRFGLGVRTNGPRAATGSIRTQANLQPRIVRHDLQTKKHPGGLRADPRAVSGRHTVGRVVATFLITLPHTGPVLTFRSSSSFWKIPNLQTVPYLTALARRDTPYASGRRLAPRFPNKTNSGTKPLQFALRVRFAASARTRLEKPHIHILRARLRPAPAKNLLRSPLRRYASDVSMYNA